MFALLLSYSCRIRPLGTKICYLDVCVTRRGPLDWETLRLKSLNGLVPIAHYVSSV